MQPKSAADSGSAPCSPSDLIDLERYPIFDLGAEPTRALTVHCRQQLDQSGACELAGFLKQEAVEILVREADSLAAHAYHSVVSGTPYLAVPDVSLPEDHPRKFFEPTFSRGSRLRSVSCGFGAAPTVRVGSTDGVYRRGSEERSALSLRRPDGRAESCGDGRRGAFALAFRS